MANLEDTLLSHHKLQHFMSRPGKLIRNEILKLCISSGTRSNIKYNEFMDNIITNYNPVNWEKAALFSTSKDIIDSIMRVTSNKYTNNKKGTALRTAVRGKGVDWLKIANFHHDVWLSAVKNKPWWSIDPRAVDAVRPAFDEIYLMFIRWSIVDFNLKTVQSIFEFANNYSPTFIRECMNKVESYSSRSIDYLSVIIEREHALLKIQLEQENRLNASAKLAIKSFLEMREHRKPVEWDKLEEEVKKQIDNDIGFNKVKLS